LPLGGGIDFSLFVRQRVHGVERKPLAACCLGIERGHPAALPAEDRFELRHRGAVLGRARGRDLAQTTRRAIWQSRLLASLLITVAQEFATYDKF